MALVVGEHLINDLRHGLVLEHPGVLPVAEEGEPGLDRQPVAGEAAVAAEQLGLCDVAVPRPQLGSALLGEQFQPHRLAEQALQFDVRVGGQGVHDDAGVGLAGFIGFTGFTGARPDRLVDNRPLGEQNVGAERGVELEQALVLRRRTGQRGEKLGIQAHARVTSIIVFFLRQVVR